jgi:hypothetical protein
LKQFGDAQKSYWDSNFSFFNIEGTTFYVPTQLVMFLTQNQSKAVDEMILYAKTVNGLLSISKMNGAVLRKDALKVRA